MLILVTVSVFLDADEENSNTILERGDGVSLIYMTIRVYKKPLSFHL